MSSLDESKRSNRRRECLCIYSKTGPIHTLLQPGHTTIYFLAKEKRIYLFIFFFFSPGPIGKNVNVRLARQTRLFKIWPTSLEKKKINIIYRKLIKNGAAEPFGKRGCSTWPLEHTEFSFFFVSFFSLFKWLKFWVGREKIPRDSNEKENQKGKKEKKRKKVWGSQLRILLAFLLKHCEMFCVYVGKCLQVSQLTCDYLEGLFFLSGKVYR